MQVRLEIEVKATATRVPQPMQWALWLTSSRLQQLESRIVCVLTGHVACVDVIIYDLAVRLHERFASRPSMAQPCATD